MMKRLMLLLLLMASGVVQAMVPAQRRCPGGGATYMVVALPEDDKSPCLDHFGEDSQGYICSACFEPFVRCQAVIVPCSEKHRAHRQCLLHAFVGANDLICPLCKERVSLDVFEWIEPEGCAWLRNELRGKAAKRVAEQCARTAAVLAPEGSHTQSLSTATKRSVLTNALFIFATRGDALAVKNILSLTTDTGKRLVNVNAQGIRQTTSLHWAAAKGHVDVINMLIEHGAAVEALAEDQSMPLFWAVARGHVGAIKALIDHGARYDVQDEHQRTPLHIAATYGHVGAIDALVKYGARVDAQDQYQATPLHAATKYNHVGAINALVKHGANVNACAQGNATPLHWAAKCEHVEAIHALIACGANIALYDAKMRTPLDVTTHVECVCTLLQAAKHLVHGI